MDIKKTQDLQAKSSSARLIHLAEQEIFPFLEERLEQTQQLISHQFKAGEDYVGSVGMLTALLELKQELISKMRRGDSAAAKLQI